MLILCFVCEGNVLQALRQLVKVPGLVTAFDQRNLGGHDPLNPLDQVPTNQTPTDSR